ncbi:hypothetical protein [Streptomyces sp. NRRL F-5630]|uniref:hypothetical protein n=1 Tax=Streptomyces sp. NRRL F-5630 TaxID=1463864 RepID=UPI003D748851
MTTHDTPATTTDRETDWWERLYGAEQPGGHRLPEPGHTMPLTVQPPVAVEKAAPAEPEAEPATEPEPDEGGEETAEPELRPEWLRPAPGYWAPSARPSKKHRPRRALSAGTRRALYNASAAGAGWLSGLAPRMCAAIDDCGRTTSIGGALVLGIATCLLVAHFLDRRTRHWWPPLAWIARIPLASAILALALYAPAAP